MDCFYINLDAATDRKRTMEANFRQMRKPDWTLTRFPAVDAGGIAALMPGNLRPAEKACFLSHRTLVLERQAGGKPYLVMEDDARFGRRTCALVAEHLPDPSLDWDICYTDLTVTSLGSMHALFTYRRQLAGKIAILDPLTRLDYVGAVAYVVNPRPGRLASILGHVQRMDAPYDCVLRDAARQGKLKALAFFPFLTTESAAVSQIQPGGGKEIDAILQTFRLMVWNECEAPAYEAVLASLPGPDAEALAFGRLAAAFSRQGLESK